MRRPRVDGKGSASWGGAREEAGELNAGEGAGTPSHGLGKLPGGNAVAARPAALGTPPLRLCPGTQGSNGGTCSLALPLEDSPGAPDPSEEIGGSDRDLCPGARPGSG